MNINTTINILRVCVCVCVNAVYRYASIVCYKRRHNIMLITYIVSYIILLCVIGYILIISYHSDTLAADNTSHSKFV